MENYMINTILWICVIAYSAHILEEYVLNWNSWVNKVFNIQISENEFLVANTVVLISGISFAMIGDHNITVSLCFPMLMLINSCVHIISTLIKRVFSPGLITSIFLFIPIPLYLFSKLKIDNRITTKQLVLVFIGGLIIMCYPVLLQSIKKRIKEYF
jgi:hypothetical protein